MRLVDDDRVVAAQLRVVADLREQQPVGHDLDRRVSTGPVGEPNRVPDARPELDLALLGDAGGDGACSDPAWLGVRDFLAPTTAKSKTDLRQLRGLARARFAGDDHDLIRLDSGGDVVAPVGDG